MKDTAITANYGITGKKSAKEEFVKINLAVMCKEEHTLLLKFL
jgi:hypothetical protein